MKSSNIVKTLPVISAASTDKGQGHTHDIQRLPISRVPLWACMLYVQIAEYTFVIGMSLEMRVVRADCRVHVCDWNES